jgi:hypothetical protein
MNEAKCATAAPVELLNDIAQDVIDVLDKVTSLANVIEGKLYGSNPQQTCDKNAPPINLQEKLICIRSQVRDIGSTLDTVQMKL